VSLGDKFYDYDFVANFPDTFRNRVSMILARQIMPPEGFDWIASDPDLFAIWLALLDDDSHSAKTLGPILFMAEDLTIKEYFDEVFAMVHYDQNPDSKKDKSFSELKGKGDLDPKKLGRKFLKWVSDGIKSGKISLADGPVHVVPGGVLITQNALHIFTKENPNVKNWNAVQTVLSGMGITKKGPLNQVFEAYMKQHNKTIITGMVVKNHAMLIPKEILKKVNPNDYVKVSEIPKLPEKSIAPNGKLINSPISANLGPNLGPKK
jgi:hypothetical protein